MTRSVQTGAKFAAILLVSAFSAFAQTPITITADIPLQGAVENGAIWTNPEGKSVLLLASPEKHSLFSVDASTRKVLSTLNGLSRKQFIAESLRVMNQDAQWAAEQDQIRNRIDNLKRDQIAMQARSDSARASAASYKMSKETAMREASSLQVQAELRKKESDAAKSRAADALGKQESSQRKLEDARKSEAETTQKFESTKATLAQLTEARASENTQYQSDIAAARASVESARKAIAAGEKNIANAKKQDETARANLTEAKRKLNAEKGKKEKAKADKIAEFESGVSAAQATADASKSAVKEAEASLKGLQSALTAATDNVKSLEKSHADRDAQLAKNITAAQKSNSDANLAMIAARSGVTTSQAEVTSAQTMYSSSLATVSQADMAHADVTKRASDEQAKAAMFDQSMTSAEASSVEYLRAKEQLNSEEKTLPGRIEEIATKRAQAQTELAKLIVMDNPRGVALAKVGSSDYLLLSEPTSQRIDVFLLPDFALVSEFGANQLKSPGAISVLGNRVWVLDEMESGSARIKEFSLAASGTGLSASFVRAFGAADATCDISSATSLAVDPDGQRIYVPVSTNASSYVAVFSTDGTYKESFGQNLITGDATSLCVWDCNARGYLIVVDSGSQCYRVFARDSYRSLAILVPNGFKGKNATLLVSKQQTDAYPLGMMVALDGDESAQVYDWWSLSQWVGLRASCR